jgi:hypothetical protein
MITKTPVVWLGVGTSIVFLSANVDLEELSVLWYNTILQSFASKREAIMVTKQLKGYPFVVRHDFNDNPSEFEIIADDTDMISLLLRIEEYDSSTK